MRQSKMTKAMALMLSLVMITSVFVGNTLSRYVTSVSSTDSARVAVWGINAGEDTVMNLFSEDYIVAGKTIAASNTDGEKIMAPGTKGEAAFEIINFEQNVAPEVAYEVKISLDDSEIDEKIKNNTSVQWKLDNGSFGTWDQLKTSILSLSGNPVGRHVYGPGEFATAFQGAQEHKISWQWIMDNNNNEMDTEMGNLALTNDLNAVIKVSITAQQVDDLVTNEYILDGADQIVNLNDIEPITIRSSADFSTFERVEVGGQPLTRDVDYTAEEGSTVITLTKEYLSKLAVGTYNIDIISNDVIATTKFKVINKTNGILIYDGSTGEYIRDYYMGTDGNPVYSAANYYTNEISVIPSETLYVSFEHEALASEEEFLGAFCNNVGAFVFFDDEDQYVAMLKRADFKDVESEFFTIKSIVVPENATKMYANLGNGGISNPDESIDFLRIYRNSYDGMKKSSYISVLSDVNNLTNKKVYALGDSITDGYLSQSRSYIDYIGSVNNMTVYERATGGNKSSDILSEINKNDSQIKKLTSEDFIIIGGFVNDPSKGVSLGEITPVGTTEFDTTTSLGTIEQIFYNYVNNPDYKAKIGVVLTCHRAQPGL